MVTSSAQDFLQPALLDRLTDDNRASKTEPREERSMNKARLRAAVLRDLAWLLNATQLTGDLRDMGDGVWRSESVPWEKYPAAHRSVINYGLPALSGQTASSIDERDLEAAVRQAILDHEPRIIAETLRVEAATTAPLLERHNLLSFRITGKIWAQPMPLELMLQTDIDVESGQVRVRDLGR